MGTVRCFWDESWKTKILPDIDVKSIASYDLVVIWQMDHFAEQFAGEHPNVVFVPMYDSSMGQHDWFWKSLTGVKIIAFSGAIHLRATRAGLQSLRVRYYPNPDLYTSERNWDSLRGFFWQRNAKITWHEIAKLIGEQRFSHFTLHGALDPVGNAHHILPTEHEREKFHLRTTSWFKDKKEFISAVDYANVNFAPRTDEGIGMSFLEAMAMGQLVVAPNRPTMNEYIVHKLNGLLYDYQSPSPLDFADARRMAHRARKSVEKGYREWNLCIPSIQSFLRPGTPTATTRRQELPIPASQKKLRNGATRKSDALCGGLSTRGRIKSDDESMPLVTVATVVYNGSGCIEKTMRSVLEQTYENIEYVVIDGASTDGTLDIIRSAENLIDFWQSEKDDGPYDAMNKAARIAQGRWILFMNAGDTFHSPRAVANAIQDTPHDADFIIGHHTYVSTDGAEHDTMTADFEETWKNLTSGNLTHAWKHGIPCHQSTFTRTKLICEHQYNTRYRITADHDFMYRMRKNGASFHHCDSHIAYYHGGGISAKNQLRCIDEWKDVALKFAEDKNNVREFYDLRRKNILLGNIAHNDWIAAWKLSFSHPSLLTSALKRAAGTGSIWKALKGLFHGKRLMVDFRDSLETSPIMNVYGISAPESWGAWTNGQQVTIRLKSPLHGRLKITLTLAHIFHSCINKPITLEFGGKSKVITPNAIGEIMVDFGTGIHGDTLRISIPHAASPAETGQSNDDRKLGIGIESLTFSNQSF